MLPVPGASLVSNFMVWIGRILSALIVLMLIPSANAKFQLTEDAVKGFEHLEWKQELAFGLGVLELACAIIYAIPYTAVLGAILLTGYFGGAIASHVRVGDPFFVQAAIPVVAWLALFLRDRRLWSLIPLRRL
jgi:hypothetical protein